MMMMVYLTVTTELMTNSKLPTKEPRAGMMINRDTAEIVETLIKTPKRPR